MKSSTDLAERVEKLRDELALAVARLESADSVDPGGRREERIEIARMFLELSALQLRLGEAGGASISRTPVRSPAST